eukprot:2175570-Pyramimonas_sp.AAC.1
MKRRRGWRSLELGPSTKGTPREHPRRTSRGPRAFFRDASSEPSVCSRMSQVNQACFQGR